LLLAQCGQLLKPDLTLDPSIIALLLRVSETYNRFDSEGGQNALTAETSGRLVRLKLLEQILRVMSHDLRSPANNITGLCNLIAGADPSEISVHLKMLSKAASNLIETIADLDAIVGALDGVSSAYETVDLKEL